MEQVITDKEAMAIHPANVRKGRPIYTVVDLAFWRNPSTGELIGVNMPAPWHCPEEMCHWQYVKRGYSVIKGRAVYNGRCGIGFESIDAAKDWIRQRFE